MTIGSTLASHWRNCHVWRIEPRRAPIPLCRSSAAVHGPAQGDVAVDVHNYLLTTWPGFNPCLSIPLFPGGVDGSWARSKYTSLCWCSV